MGKKKPRAAFDFKQPQKTPRGAAQAEAIQSKNFCWRVSDIDWQGSWGWTLATTSQIIGTIVPKLHDYETMKWSEIEGRTRSHFVEFDALCPEAQARLLEIGKDEQARLFSVRITGAMRVWGLRDVAILRVLWWDPDHTVCPAEKKHT